MKLGVKTALLAVLGGILGSTGARAVVSEAAGNPYQGITERNIFGLKPPPPPTSPESQNKLPTPKIKLTGITTILGRKQVLACEKTLGDPSALMSCMVNFTSA